jgi:hypothetical protein
MSKDKISLELDGKRHEGRMPYEGADHCLVDVDCPHCKAPAPIKVAGAKRRIDPDHRHDTYKADGGHLDCGNFLGPLRYKVAGTLFGIEEDERVYAMAVKIGARIY